MILALLFFSIYSVIGFSSDKVTRVCPSECEFRTIQAAVDFSKDGDTIEVDGGIYNEGEVIIKRPLTLIGIHSPVIIGNSKDKKDSQPIIIFKTHDVTVSGFEIRETATSYTSEIAGVRLVESRNCTVESNHFFNTTYGVYLEKSENCTVRGNSFNNNRTDESSAGNGVHAWAGSGHLIEGNQISGYRDGIYLEFAKDCTVNKNRVSRNIRYGLHFMTANHSSYSDNEFSENGSGVAVMYARQIEMHRNHFSRNTGAAAYGLLLKSIQASHLVENTFEGNTVGIFMEDTNRSEFRRNTFKNNGWGLRIMSDCESNVFSENQFLENTFEVSTNADRSFNTFTRNYWSRYEGYDLNHDGIGDVPHRPVSLSSVLLERVDSSYILLNSLFFQLLDSIERVLPQMIPEPLKDEKPLMKPLIFSKGQS